MFDIPSNGNSQHRVVRKRNRVPVSCIPCRARRSKCDRGHPCTRCIQNGEPESCEYYQKHASPSNETVILQESRYPKEKSNWENHTEIEVSFNQNDGRGNGSQWRSVLEDLNHMNAVARPRHEVNPVKENKASLLAKDNTIDLDQVCGMYLPTRAESDRLLSRYFSSQYGPLPILHKGQYARTYLAWWSENDKANPLFLSTLFSAYCIGLFATGPRSDEVVQQTQRFNLAAAKCLTIGDITRPQPWLIEALFMHFHVQYISSLDPPREICMLVPYLIRLVYETGINREPGQGVSAFKAEMQRRHFIAAQHFDVVLSYQTGMPISLLPGTHDIHEAHNLYDDDFDEDSEELPPSRPETDVGLVMCFVVKHRMMTVFTKAYRRSLDLHPISREERMKLDAEARAEQERIPKPLKIRPLCESFIDSQLLIMTRLNCEFLAQRTICVLHRKAMVGGDPEALHICVDAACVIVECLVDIHKEVRPGGQVETYGRMISSTMINDFFLASMILCFAVSLVAQARARGEEIFPTSEIEKIRFLLQQSHRISMSISSLSVGAKKVAHTVNTAMSTIKSYSTIFPPLLQSEHSDTSSLGGVSLSETISLTDSSPTDTIWSDPDFEAMLNDPTGIDWSSLDQFLNYPST